MSSCTVSMSVLALASGTAANAALTVATLLLLTPVLVFRPSSRFRPVIHWASVL